MNDDRISELYKGEIWSESLQERARRRIHWVCGQVVGDRVLDIGCSQGIVPILLAREGFEVVGVDIQPDRIGYALDDLAKEPPLVQELVTFEVANGSDLNYPDGGFDTVVLGEVIEHLSRPDRILAEASRLLHPEGKLVLTTPFGVSRHHDHRQTFYPLGLFDLISAYFTVTELEIADRYFRIVAGRRSNSGGVNGPLESLRGIDAGVRALDSELSSSQTALADSNAALAKEKQASAVKAEEVRGQRLDLERSHQALDAARQELMERDADLDQLAEAEARNLSLEETVRSINGKIESHEGYIGRLRSENSRLRGSVGKAKRANARVRYKLELATWKLRSLHARKWWRMGHALARVRRQPWRILVLPFDWISIGFGTSSLPKRPSLPKAARSQSRSSHPKSDSLSRHDALLARIRDATPSAPAVIPKRNLRVAALLDEFSHVLFEHEFHIVEVTPDNWQQVLHTEPDLLLVESAWRGKDDAWLGHLAKVEGPSEDFSSMVRAFRSRSIPTVFWNKEDPPNYELYINAARLFDTVFTVCEECIPRYRTDLGHERVYTSPFSVQPLIHNPISVGDREGGVAFAGTYYAKKHPERVRQVEAVLDPARQFPLTIYSRVASAGNYEWPERFTPFIAGTLSYSEVLTAYKMHDVFVNVNSVTDSASMCARRVFELAASGTPIVSGTSPAISNFFGDIVFQAEDEASAEFAFRALLQSPELRLRTSHRGLREVMRSNTASHRVGDMLNQVGIQDPHPVSLPPVSLVVPTNRPEQLDHVLDGVSSQTYPNLQLVVAAHGFTPNTQDLRRKGEDAGISDLVICEVSHDLSLGDVINIGVERADGAYIGKIDDDNYYGPEYVWDLMDSFTYSRAGITGKWSHFTYVEGLDALVLRFPGFEHSYVDLVAGSAMIVERSVFDAIRFPSEPVGEDTKFLRQAKQHGVEIFSADRFNYVYMRYRDAAHHTFQVSDVELVSKGELVQYGLNLVHVTV